MKNKKKIEVPAYAFGTEQISNMIKALPEATTLIASPFQQSTATSGGEAFAQSVAGIGQGINAGMEIGKNFGAAGALVGGAIGAGVGLIGKGGREASMSSFTELDEGTLGTGLTGMFKNRRLRRKRNRLRQIAANNRDAVRGTNYLQNEYGEDYGDMDVNTFADGGYTSSLAYVDDGELIQTPDGTISKVPENNKPTDSNLIDLPEGSRILSDKLKVPGKKETFAQLGEKMMAKNKSKYNDKYAENAAKLNEINNNIIHNQLFAMQEQVKKKKGIKPKYKGLPAYSYGNTEDDKGPKKVKINYVVSPFGQFSEMNSDGSYTPLDDVSPQNLPNYRYYDSAGKPISESEYNSLIKQGESDRIKEGLIKFYNDHKESPFPKQFNPVYVDYSKMPKGGYGQKKTSVGSMQSYTNGRYDYETLRAVDPYAFGYERREAIKPQQVAPAQTVNTNFSVVPKESYNYVPTNDTDNVATNVKNTPLPKKRRTSNVSATVNKSEQPIVVQQSNEGIKKPKYPDRLIATNAEIIKPDPKIYKKTDLDEAPTPDVRQPGPKGRFDWGSALSGIASLAPIMSNLFTGKPESVDAVYNPYATAITNTMRRRRFNIDPAIQDINRNRAISNYNIRQMNTNTGANMAYSLQSAVDTNKAITNLRSMESNANNQYLGEYANTMNNLGQQWVGATNLAAEANAQNRATNRNIRRAGISQLSQWAQNRELMRNQEARDNAMLAMYGPFLQAGYTANTIKEFNRWLNKGGNYVG